MPFIERMHDWPVGQQSVESMTGNLMQGSPLFYFDHPSLVLARGLRVNAEHNMSLCQVCVPFFIDLTFISIYRDASRNMVLHVPTRVVVITRRYYELSKLRNRTAMHRDGGGHNREAHHRPPSAAIPAMTMPFLTPISAMLHHDTFL